MATATSDIPLDFWPATATAADMLERLGGIVPQRVRMTPPPGTASVVDVERMRRQTGAICELVDSVLVEKIVGYYESRLAAVLGYFIERYLEERPLGMTLGRAGALAILPGVVRAADLAFVRWERLPGGRLPKDPVPSLVPDLAVEILSPGNTAAEMERKRGEYLAAGVAMVWFIDPPTRSAVVYRPGAEPHRVSPEGTLDGGDVLPGFQLPLGELFARAEGPAR